MNYYLTKLQHLNPQHNNMSSCKCKSELSNNTTLVWIDYQANGSLIVHTYSITCSTFIYSWPFVVHFFHSQLHSLKPENVLHWNKKIFKKTLIFLISNLRCTKDEPHILFSCISSWHLCSHILLCSSFFYSEDIFKSCPCSSQQVFKSHFLFSPFSLFKFSLSHSRLSSSHIS